MNALRLWGCLVGGLLLCAGCATTNPAVPKGTRIYLQSVTYVGEDRVAMGRAFAPMLEAEIRKLIEGAGVVSFVADSERSMADYSLVMRITDVRHELKISLYLPGDSYSYGSEIWVEGESCLTPRKGPGHEDEFIRKFPVRTTVDMTLGFIGGQPSNGTANPSPRPEWLKLGSPKLLHGHVGSTANRTCLTSSSSPTEPSWTRTGVRGGESRSSNKRT